MYVLLITMVHCPVKLYTSLKRSGVHTYHACGLYLHSWISQQYLMIASSYCNVPQLWTRTGKFKKKIHLLHRTILLHCMSTQSTTWLEWAHQCMFIPSLLAAKSALRKTDKPFLLTACRRPLIWMARLKGHIPSKREETLPPMSLVKAVPYHLRQCSIANLNPVRNTHHMYMYSHQVKHYTNHPLSH